MSCTLRNWIVLIYLSAAILGCNENSNSLHSGSTDDSGLSDGNITSNDNDRGIIGDASQKITIIPLAPQITVETGKPIPTVQFSAMLGSTLVTAKWSLDQGELGNISSTGLFTPASTIAGQAKVTAVVGSLTHTTTVTVLLKMTQNGATENNGNPGPGGFGGVGGEGLGPATPASTIFILDGSPTSAPTLTMIYPYNNTVWPLGILAPLLQWTPPPEGQGDAVKIELSSSRFEYTGYFGRPVTLDTHATFVRHPIPQDVWKAATRSAAGNTLTIRLTIASQGKAYGPLTATWTISKGSLKGTVYYQSYGTNLAKNYSGAIGGDGKFGGATLAIKGDSTDPILVAGKDGSKSECRVCHSVSLDGSRMIVQHGESYKKSSSYDLLHEYLETAYPSSTDGKLGWIGMTPDGKLGLGNAAPIPGTANTDNTALYDMNSGEIVDSPGLSSLVTKAGFPMFSPDGKRVAFNFYAGSGDSAIGSGDSKKLVMMDFDPTNHTFSNPKLLYDGNSTNIRPGWPTFWPTGNALVFQREVAINTLKEFFGTRNGGQGDLWWVDLATGTAYPLNLLNGKGSNGLYLPAGPNNHDDDSTLNYEPTISPIASGGYAWIVFMSRRLYGNVATIDPWWSDPREHDLTQTPTPKKLWVAALDLDPKPGTDPSHPPFYLPAQELMAGNSRGFWVLDPCKPDGQTCTTGDECCGGYCIQRGEDGTQVCGATPILCALEFDRCEKSTDCCDYPTFTCINNRCTRQSSSPDD